METRGFYKVLVQILPLAKQEVQRAGSASRGADCYDETDAPQSRDFWPDPHRR